MDFSSGALLSTPVPFSMHLYTRITNKHDNLIQIGLSPRLTVNIFRLSVKRNIKRVTADRDVEERERERGNQLELVSFHFSLRSRSRGRRKNTIDYNHVHISPFTRVNLHVSICGSKFRGEISREEVRIADCRVRRQHWKRFETVSTEQECDDELREK